MIFLYSFITHLGLPRLVRVSDRTISRATLMSWQNRGTPHVHRVLYLRERHVVPSASLFDYCYRILFDCPPIRHDTSRYILKYIYKFDQGPGFAGQGVAISADPGIIVSSDQSEENGNNDDDDEENGDIDDDD